MAHIYYIHKGIAGFSAVLSISVLVVCTWIFSSILQHPTEPGNDRRNIISYEEEFDNMDMDVRYATESKYPEIDIRLGAYLLSYPTTTTTTTRTTTTTTTTTPRPEKFLRSPDKNSTFKNETGSHYLATFDRMPKTFKKIITTCVWLSNISALMQFCSCFFILCSSTLKMPQRAKYFLAIHFLVFTVLIVTFFIPGAYDRDEDQYYSMTGFNMKVKKSISGFSTNLKHFLHYDLNSYYTFLAVDISFLFLIMVSICCLMRYEMDFYDPV